MKGQGTLTLTTDRLGSVDVPTVSDVLHTYGPFLPYSVLFGSPAGSQEFPYWTNLLQKGLWGFEYWAETLPLALRMAAVAVESLALTSVPRQVQFLALTPHAQGIPEWKREYWLGIYGNYAHTEGDHWESWQKGWKRIFEELRKRRSNDQRGPTHWILLLIGVGQSLPKEPEAKRKLKGLFREGPSYGLWPIVVDTYAHWHRWRPYIQGIPRIRLLDRWTKEHRSAARDLEPYFGQLQVLKELEPGTALMVHRQGHVVLEIPRPSWPWEEVLWAPDPGYFYTFTNPLPDSKEEQKPILVSEDPVVTGTLPSWTSSMIGTD